MERWLQAVVILVFALLLTAGLDYAGRNMHRALGGDEKCYTFLRGDLADSQVIFCGQAYPVYQAENLYSTVRNTVVCAQYSELRMMRGLVSVLGTQRSALILALSTRYSVLTRKELRTLVDFIVREIRGLRSQFWSTVITMEWI